MASVYILYSAGAEKYYIGYTKNIVTRINYHHEKEFPSSFTAKYEDWVLFFSIDNIEVSSARKIEGHIKRMKSKVYIENLKKHASISQELIQKYS